MYRTFTLRFVYPLSSNQLGWINDKGELQGDIKKVVEEAIIYITRNFNLTWIRASEHLRTNGEIAEEAMVSIGHNEADGAMNSLLLLNGLPENVTATPIVNNQWCKLVSSPKLMEAVVEEGPESAFMQIRLDFLFPILVGLLIVLHLAHLVVKKTNILVSVWLIYAYLLRQSISSMLRKSFLLGYFVLIFSAMLIQILYGSFLHTERTSVTSFIHLDSVEDTYKYNAERLVLDISDCPKMVKEFKDYTVISVAENVQNLGDHDRCIQSAKCAMIVNNFDFAALLAGSCSILYKVSHQYVPYLSPALKNTLVGFFLNKKLPKKLRNHLDSWISRSFEMGLETKKGGLSSGIAIQVIRRVFRMNVNQECFSKSLQTSMSTPAPLNHAFYGNCFIFYFVIGALAFFNHIFSLWASKSSLIPESVPQMKPEPSV